MLERAAFSRPLLKFSKGRNRCNYGRSECSPLQFEWRGWARRGGFVPHQFMAGLEKCGHWIMRQEDGELLTMNVIVTVNANQECIAVSR